MGVLVDFDRVATEPVERRAHRFEFFVERAERQPFDHGAAALGALAQALKASDLARRAIQRYRLEIRTTEHRAVQAGAVMQQISLGDVATHAVAEQHDRHAGMLLADVLVEARQIAHYLAPAIVVGKVAECAVFRCFAMPALIQRIHAVTLIAALLCQAGIAVAVFGHAVGQQDHGF
ncbi:hypothetical protein D3C73_1046120 [compost metagenome]